MLTVPADVPSSSKLTADLVLTCPLNGCSPELPPGRDPVRCRVVDCEPAPFVVGP